MVVSGGVTVARGVVVKLVEATGWGVTTGAGVGVVIAWDTGVGVGVIVVI